MRHRITDLYNGLGNSEPVKMDNNIQLEKSEFWDNFLEDAIKTFSVIRDYDGFDYHIDENKPTRALIYDSYFDSDYDTSFIAVVKTDTVIEDGEIYYPTA